MNYSTFVPFASEPRLNRYLIACNGDKEKALLIYKQNLLLCSSLMPIISVFEVTLRNKINIVLSDYFNDPDWILNERAGFMIDNQLKGNTRVLDGVNKVETKLNKFKKPVSSDNIISNLDFSFWTNFFNKNYVILLRHEPIKIFDSKPPFNPVETINWQLRRIRSVRNKTCHNESFCFKGQDFDLIHIAKEYQLIINMMSWLEPSVVPVFNSVDSVHNRIDRLKKTIYGVT